MDSGVGAAPNSASLAARAHSLVAWSILCAYFVVVGLASGLYRAFALEPSAAFQSLCRLAFLIAIASWFSEYARRNRLTLPMDMGFFLYVASFLLVPYFVLRTEGWKRGTKTLVILIGLALASLAIELGVGMWGTSVE